MELSLDELTATVEELLRAHGLSGVQRDGRVSSVPDARTIRYYGSLGLVDRPAVVGRQARYGRRHVLQLLAIKALQGEGLPLGEVQARLYGRSDAELERIVDAWAGAAQQAPPAEPAAAVRPVVWREVALEPGLKIVAEDGWSPSLDPETLERRIRAALAALKLPTTPPSGANGGNQA